MVTHDYGKQDRAKMSGRGKYTREEAADPAVRRMGRQGQKAVLGKGTGSGVPPFRANGVARRWERGGGLVLSCALLLRERGRAATREGEVGATGRGATVACSLLLRERGSRATGEGVMAVTGRGRQRHALVRPPSRAKGVAWAWGKGKGTGSGVPPFRVNGAAVNGKGKGRRQATYLVRPLFAHERGGNGLGEMGAGGKRKQGSEPEPCSGSKHVPLTWQARTCSSVPSPLWVPLRIALPPLASPGPIRFEKGTQEGTADASASRAAPFVRKKRAHEGGARGHTATPLSPSTPLPLPLWLSLPASAEGAHAAAASPSPVAPPPLSRGRRAHESTRPPPLSHRHATPFARKGGTPLPVPLPFPHVHVTPFAREGAHKDGLLSLSPHASHSRVRGLLVHIFTAPAHFRAT
ncbi:hypothetical protein EDB84DRAFT_1443241 [Lactarius hengduanensis]|nr:hypothetical protein EDB84DRAFT_1443241 [Lactarius hengduanensis]